MNLQIYLPIQFANMYDTSNFFAETIYPKRRDKFQQKSSEICSWAEDTKESHNILAFKPSRKGSSNRRYTSELQSSNAKKEEKHKTIKNQSFLLPERSIVIEYEADSSTSRTYQHSLIPTKLKLPVLCSKKLSQQSSHKQTLPFKEKWNFLIPTHRRSLKRHSPKLRSLESPPQFQIYKRSLMAARKYVLETLTQVEGIEQKL